MTALAHFVAVSCYLGATAAAATPFARPVPPPVRIVVFTLGAGVIAHLVALAGVSRSLGLIPLTGLGPALSFAGLMLGIVLLVAELLAREVTLTLVAAPLAAFVTSAAVIIGLTPALDPVGARGVWLISHILMSFVGIAAHATAAAAGAMYLVEHRQLKARQFGAVFRFFPPLETLDRVNHIAAIAGWMVLTLGIVLAISYSVTYQAIDVAQSVWGIGAWACLTAIALGRVIGGMQAKRAATASVATFALVLVAYLALRLTLPSAGRFL